MVTLHYPEESFALDRLMRPRLGLLTRGVQRVQTLPALLPDWHLVHGTRRGPLDAVLAWGHKPSAEAARQHALRHRLPLIRIEDGFLRSVELGHRSPPLSIVVDDLGIYYDASAPSRLEALIARGGSPAQHLRAARLRAMWVEERVSKYNHSRLDACVADAGRSEGPVLVVDQTAGDASITGSGASASHFHTMLEAALDEHPRAQVWLKVHPDVIAGRKHGHFESLSPGQSARIRVIGEDLHPPALFESCRAVYVVSSQMGFEALMWQRPVRCFGLPFFAGWGLTQDHQAAPTRRHPVTLEALVHAALVVYPRYLDPETGATCSPERLIAHLALQRRMRARFPAQVQALGFSRWKRPIARAFFGGSTLQFLRRPGQARAPAPLAVWGRRPAPEGAAGPVIRVEDGFIRSVGLGADLTRPLSWVLDDLGIYFDASAPSRLEDLLQTHAFDAPLLARARRLREAVVSAGITKYNVGQGEWQPPSQGRPVVLVPGQVESDASIAWGCADIHTNLALLQAVRAAVPHAYLVYKPHPDVLAGLRGSPVQARQMLEDCRAWCDEIVSDANMAQLLDQVDAVHTLTSLAGFEALLRGKQVTTWGLPFYAGWGLTDDRAPADTPALQRRQRRLHLDELVAATLILYPSYISRVSGVFTSPERALHELSEWRQRGADAPSAWSLRPMKRALLRFAARLRGV